MPPERPRLPPFAALRAFHAAASYDRFRDAAEALGITESAISHQVRRLEEYLHVALFERTGSGARLTPAGQRYLEAIDPAIRQIQTATDALLGGSGRRVVRLTLPASLAATWLIPHLSAFERAYPDIELQLVTTTRVLDLRRNQIDLAIRHGKGTWPGVASEFLLHETAFPVAAPGYLTVREDEDPHAAVSRARLIVNTRSPDEWEEWSRARGLSTLTPAATFEIEGQEEALRVAERGLGLAIGRRLFIEDRLANGTLVAPFGAADPSGAAYYLCRPNGVTPTAAARRTERWLHELAVET
ncbi:LysR substrate-binding domain-containing protein [Chelativorans alearense]|uniref:LysR substrate-binding domain-containing protein n=1 Tax=Chelativorans alearense TaxID=2681495 RepID=UPI0013D475B8|nr:LysR substrate-binding domain-containing protein [Chelativorans alearense]